MSGNEWHQRFNGFLGNFSNFAQMENKKWLHFHVTPLLVRQN
jgi:hypothetical protein